MISCCPIIGAHRREGGGRGEWMEGAGIAVKSFMKHILLSGPLVVLRDSLDGAATLEAVPRQRHLPAFVHSGPGVHHYPWKRLESRHTHRSNYIPSAAARTHTIFPALCWYDLWAALVRVPILPSAMTRAYSDNEDSGGDMNVDSSR